MYFRLLEKSLEPQNGHERHKTFLEWFEGRFLMELMNEPTRRDDLLNPTTTGKNWLKTSGLEETLSEGTGALQGMREVS